MDGLLPRHVQGRVEDLLNVFPAVELIGARQVGKSTLAAMIAEAADRPARLLTLDDAETREAATADPRGFLALEPEGLLVIDEFQRVPGLALALKATIDSHRADGRFLLTGSVTMPAARPAGDSLAGRVVGTRVFGFSQGERAGRRDDFVRAVLRGALEAQYRSGMGRADYVDLLAAGSMPEACRLPQRYRADWLESYVSRLLGRDLREFSRLSDPRRLRSLLVALAAAQGSETVVARLGGAVNLSASTTAGSSPSRSRPPPRCPPPTPGTCGGWRGGSAIAWWPASSSLRTTVPVTWVVACGLCRSPRCGNSADGAGWRQRTDLPRNLAEC